MGDEGVKKVRRGIDMIRPTRRGGSGGRLSAVASFPGVT